MDSSIDTHCISSPVGLHGQQTEEDLIERGSRNGRGNWSGRRRIDLCRS